MKNPSATKKGPGRRPVRVGQETRAFNYYMRRLNESNASEEALLEALEYEPFADRAGAKIARQAKNQTISKRC